MVDKWNHLFILLNALTTSRWNGSFANSELIHQRNDGWGWLRNANTFSYCRKKQLKVPGFVITTSEQSIFCLHLILCGALVTNWFKCTFGEWESKTELILWSMNWLPWRDWGLRVFLFYANKQHNLIQMGNDWCCFTLMYYIYYTGCRPALWFWLLIQNMDLLWWLPLTFLRKKSKLQSQK